MNYKHFFELILDYKNQKLTRVEFMYCWEKIQQGKGIEVYKVQRIAK